MSDQRIVWIDFETGGLDSARHPIIQFAAIATTASPEFRIVESDSALVQFDESTADPEALRINHFDPQRWAQEAISQGDALARLDAILRRHATVRKVSKRTGRPYDVARVGGHNVAFDCGFLKALYGRSFCPADAWVGSWLCTMELAKIAGDLFGFRPESLKLTDVAKALGIETDDAHDALADVRMSIEVARAFAGSAQRVAS